MKFKVKHPLDLPPGTEYWEVSVSWDSQSKWHLFSTVESAIEYAQKRANGFVKARANSDKYRPLELEWRTPGTHISEGDCVTQALLGPKVLNTPVWDYSVKVKQKTRRN